MVPFGVIRLRRKASCGDEPKRAMMFMRTARNPRLDFLVGAASLWISWAFFIDAWSHENLPYENFFTWAPE